MELMSYFSAPCCHVIHIQWKSINKSSSLARKNNIMCARIDSKLGHLGSRGRHFFPLKKSNQPEASRSLESFEGFQHVNDKTLRRCNDGYVISGEEDVRNISERGDSTARILIPGMPDESNGAPVVSGFWEWKPKLNVHYEKSGTENSSSPAVLFLPGFGVGTFHYEKQLKDLGRDFRVWALDFLGQGMSLPFEDPTFRLKEGVASEEKEDLLWGFGDETESWANKLVYSTDLWKDQVRSFVEEVIGEPVYVVGNSLGGYVALYFAACNPKLVKGVTLLNATPFWGFLPNPVKSPKLARLFPWAGTFPLPTSVRKLTELLWQKISDPESIAVILKQVYADHSTKVDKVFSQILATTQHPAAAASFASIMFAPKGQLSFGEALSGCRMSNVPISLMYGKEDPWVKPLWGLQVKRQFPEAPYYEISPAGHCPHDEVPEVVNYLLRGWIRSLESEGLTPMPLVEQPPPPDHGISKDLEFARDGIQKSVKVRLPGNGSSPWTKVRSFIKSGLEGGRLMN